jgi:hypothetical protein
VLSGGAAAIRVTTPDLATARAVFARLGLSEDTGLDRDADSVTARLGDTAVEQVASALVAAGVRLRGLVVERPDLEDLFVSITGEGFDVLS